MHTEVAGRPAFAHIHVTLEPGESLLAEPGAMASMAGDLEVATRLNGSFWAAAAKGLLGGESLLINHYTNTCGDARSLTLTQQTPGDIREIVLEEGRGICLQPGAYLSSTDDLKLGVKWAGLTSFIAREGLFKLYAEGPGTLWFGAYGGLVDKQVDGEYVVDTGHLVAYDPAIQLRTSLAGGPLSSFFGGEGLVTRLEGTGQVVLQTRSIGGLVDWLNPRLDG